MMSSIEMASKMAPERLWTFVNWMIFCISIYMGQMWKTGNLYSHIEFVEWTRKKQKNKRIYNITLKQEFS